MDDLPSLHNISFSLNLTSILDLLPSRLLARLMFRSKPAASPTQLNLDTLSPPTISDFIATNDWETPLALVTKSQTGGAKTKLGSSSADERSLLLGPLGFFTSGYMLALFLMAFLLHRLHHTVIPSRLTRRGLLRRGRHYSGRAIVFIRIYRSIFPIDLSRTATRFVLQFPTLYCLLRTCVLWGIIILQTSGMYPETLPVWMPERFIFVAQKLGHWASHKPMDEVCWISFCSLGLAYFVESFVRKLDELANGTVEEVHLGRQMSPYNLVAHSFVLYLFSLSASHVHKPDGLPPRPDTHALITMGIPLLQSTIFHILCISKKYSNHRLIPTALTSFLGLIHFHTTLLTRGYPAMIFGSLIRPDGTKDSPNNVFSGTGFRSSYPLMNYFSCLIESCLISIILLTVFLNALVQLLVNGRVDRVLTTLGIAAAGGLTDNPDADSAQFSWSNLPFEEEWGVVLMRIGTASLEATGLKGWGNEVAPISAPVRAPPQFVRRRGRGPNPVPPLEPSVTYGSVRMGRSGVGSVLSGHKAAESSRTGTASSSRVAPASGRQVAKPVQLKGWNNEVRSVETNAGGSARRGAEGRRWVWLRELVRFSKAASGALRGLLRLTWRWVCQWRGRKGYAEAEAEAEERLRHRPHITDVDVGRLGLAVETERRRAERELYERFLRGEEISDDEDEDAALGGGVDSESEDGSEGSSDVGDEDWPLMRLGDGSVVPEEEQQEREDEAIALFADLVRTQGVDEGSKLVLSHLVHGSAVATGREDAPVPPLTRRRWGEMGRRWGLAIMEGPDEDAWDLGVATARRDVDVGGEKDGEVDWTDRAMCIICTSKPRDVVSWPCRCLVMCDQCREVLAARGSPGKHCCPCCRQPIDGYSRIFIP
ncbi:hypothetical protein P691DRAFT_711400 [Macrolepiota fuliginosa MF-IS2]|uniref:RING-type domain-containing protein n=1 Tax=Macrolepiota fuliginosa MF-IS2 TaxID=1400762 RepID=A0A9P5X8I5_9AGAR|nr:hypothetical protein P691DRAFT_711400 [Macrolepiota fuliginosa MF-IS2]